LYQAPRKQFRELGIVVPLRFDSSTTPDLRADEIASISHELRNSLAVIRSAAHLLQAPADSVRIDNARILIERHIQQMSRHVDDLLEVGFSPAGKKPPLSQARIDLRTVVEDSVSAVAAEFARRGHHLSVKLPDDALWVQADAARLEQVFSNLLINAAKYTPDGGVITVTLDDHSAQARIGIRDSGIGMDSSILSRAFDIYAQADAASARSEGGVGIGLAVVRGLVEQHGGSVHAASAGLGLGSEFTVLLPLLWGTAYARPPQSSRR
jgi:signal transduction histidine kinase